ncbi:TonB-dependent receptor [Dechloromonas denitrificans]|uniref:TonB-dependent receptor n=1 Tax=Azonexaceae TaxID=2008795 RepID=UPI001CF9D1E9|nr:TonB-dependent receptor [Dechloromonas denitrificans]UCV06022.1 TonB-dependent receptor [Dechloromonas denitrificans]
MAGLAFLGSGQAYAADDGKALTELQAENLRLKKEIEALKQRANGAAAVGVPATVVSGGDATSAVTKPNVPVQAGDDGVVAFDKVIVTSRNREEIAQDVPLPVTVLGGDRLDREDIKSIYDLPSKVPNLQLNNPGENARKVSPSIRGLGRGGANDSMEQSVGVIVDGVTLYYSGQAWADYVDLDRIEVLNGPQGTLMGKNTSLGAINILTKAPSFRKASTFELFTGDQNTLSGKFSSTGALVDGLLAYRANFVADRSDGIYTNTYQSMGHSKETWRESNKLAGRFQVLWTPSEDLTGRFIFDKLRSDERVNTGNTLVSNGPTTYADGSARPTVTPFSYAPTGSYANYGYLGQFARKAAWFHNANGSVYQPPLNTTDIQNSEARPQITNQWGLAGTFDWRVADHTLTSITAYRYQDFDIKNGGQYGQFYVNNGGQQLWNEQFSQELRFSSTPSPAKKLDYQAGLYYLKARVYSDDPSYYGQDAGAWYAKDNQFTSLMGSAAGRALLQASLNGVYQSRVTDARVESLAAYGQADWHLTEKATLTFGVRQTQETKENRVSHQIDRPGENLAALGTSLGLAANSPLITTAQAIRDGQVYSAFDWRNGNPIKASLTAWNVGPSYKVNDDVLLYSSYGKGVKSGFIFFGTDGAADETQIKPEETYDLELGFKSLLLNRKLMLNANAYYTTIKNYQASWRRENPASPGSFVSGWGNVEKIGAKGLELQTAYQYNSRLSLDFNAAYNIAKYETEWLAQVPEISATKYFDLKGEQVTNVPKLSLSYGFNYQAPVAGYLGRFSLSNSYRSGAYLNDNHASFSYQEAYTVTNLGIGLGALDRSWEVSVLGRNVLDKEYYTSASTWSSTAAQTVTWGSPRTWMLVFKSKI